MTTVWAVIAVVLVLVGLAGTMLPGLPGAVLVLAGLVWLAWLDDFARIGAGYDWVADDVWRSPATRSILPQPL